jgi:hypothetical protein
MLELEQPDRNLLSQVYRSPSSHQTPVLLLQEAPSYHFRVPLETIDAPYISILGMFTAQSLAQQGTTAVVCFSAQRLGSNWQQLRMHR